MCLQHQNLKKSPRGRYSLRKSLLVRFFGQRTILNSFLGSTGRFGGVGGGAPLASQEGMTPSCRAKSRKMLVFATFSTKTAFASRGAKPRLPGQLFVTVVSRRVRRCAGFTRILSKKRLYRAVQPKWRFIDTSCIYGCRPKMSLYSEKIDFSKSFGKCLEMVGGVEKRLEMAF